MSPPSPIATRTFQLVALLTLPLPSARRSRSITACDGRSSAAG